MPTEIDIAAYQGDRYTLLGSVKWSATVDERVLGHDEQDVRGVGEDPPPGAETVQVRKVQIHDDHFRLQGTCLLDPYAPRTGRSDYVESSSLEGVTEHFRKQDVVIHDEDGYGGSPLSPKPRRPRSRL
jgi:hypothetical protein